MLEALLDLVATLPTLLQLNQKGVLAGYNICIHRHLIGLRQLTWSMHITGKLQSKCNQNFPSLGYSGTGEKWFVIKARSPSTKACTEWCCISSYKQRIWENALWNSSKFIRMNTRELFSLKASKKTCVLPLWKILLTDINMKINQCKYTYLATSHRAGWEQKCYRMPRVHFITPSLVFSLILLIFQNSRQPHHPDTTMGHIRHESKSLPLLTILSWWLQGRLMCHLTTGQTAAQRSN